MKVERPPLHVGIEVVEIRIVVYGLETWGPMESFCQHSGERCLAAADVSCDCDVHNPNDRGLKQAEQAGVYLVDDARKVFFVVLIVEVVHVDDEHSGFIFSINEVFLKGVQVLKILER